MSLKVNEIYYSIQGESSFSGLPCIFVRLTYCNLRCSYCDTEYAFYEGKNLEINQIIEKVNSFKCNLVEITGGEPLLQNDCIKLIEELEKNNKRVLIETGGSLTIKNISKKTHIILDLKCPSSKMEHKNLWDNLNYIKKTDEVKFVIGNKSDYNWSKKIIKKYNLENKCLILMSPVFGEIDNKKIIDWILKDNLNVRFQIQLHKKIWDKDKKGV
ncbi:MAG: 7-carboxy-7-deazaguanine synthase [Candidatus Marinimicrobia bacterium]|nr:7-carboxy-7-deazaguanine synthase [Candidatus Neomarinimicrobiota bacterium]|tara:strand:- start:680 stop:1321 length:642 start_codon:yes stop_codon:yes gene_type:complete